MTAERRGLGIVAGFYLALGLWLSSQFATWSDEEYTLETTAHGVGYAVRRGIEYELQAPLYFAILALWRDLDHSVWFARLFSLLCAVGFFFAAAAISKRIVPGKSSLPFAILATFNPFVVMAALDIRLYALALFLAALLWLFYDAGFARGSSVRARAAFVICAILGVYVQYFLGFMLVGFFVAQVVRNDRRALGAYTLCALVAGLAAVPLAKIALGQSGVYATQSASAPVLALALLHPWADFFLPHVVTVGDEPAIEHVAYAAAGLLLALAWFLSRPRLDRAVLGESLSAATVAGLFVLLTLAIGQRLPDRYFVALYVPVAVASYTLLAASTARPPWPQRSFVAIVVLATVVALVCRYRFVAQIGDWRRVAAYLDSAATAGDVIAIYPSDSLPSFEREYHGAATVVPFPRRNPVDRYDPRVLDVRSIGDAEASLARFAGAPRFWFVDAIRCPASDPQYGCMEVRAAIARDYRALSTKEFYISTVELLARRRPAQAKHGR